MDRRPHRTSEPGRDDVDARLARAIDTYVSSMMEMLVATNETEATCALFFRIFKPQLAVINEVVRRLREQGITDRARIDAALGPAAARLYARALEMQQLLGETAEAMKSRVESDPFIQKRWAAQYNKRLDRVRSRPVLDRRCTAPRGTARRSRRNVHRRASAATGGSADDGEGGGLDPPPLPVPRPASQRDIYIVFATAALVGCAAIAGLIVGQRAALLLPLVALAAAGLTGGEQYCSCADLARRWSCSRSYAWTLIRSGRLRAVRFPSLSTKPSRSTRGDLLRVPLAEVERFEREHLEVYEPNGGACR